jgi:alkylation response protein AidB-like acyl-CoA dehydrogenase
MELSESAAQRDVREAYRIFLASVLPADYADRYAHYRNDMTLRRDYQRAAFEDGWLMPHWEPELGGRQLGAMEMLSVRLEAAERAAPKLPNIQGPNVVAPALRSFGTDEHRQRYLVPVLRGDEWWALGMSEPEAGSDFASLRTSAERRDGSFTVNGQKVWTSHAHEARFATLYARTDPNAPKHRGISCLILDLAAPGVTVRPIGMVTTTTDVFCEVFLDDVQLGADALLGPLHGGWKVAMSALTDERDMIWIMNWVDLERALSTVAAAGDGRLGDDVLVDLGRCLADAKAVRATGLRAVTERQRGRELPAALGLKLFGSEALQRAWDLAVQVTGLPAATDLDGVLFEDLEGLSATIYGGTSEVQRTIVAERALGLPRA